LIEAKVNGDDIVEAPTTEPPPVINLMEALQASVAEAQASRGKTASPAANATSQRASRRTKQKASVAGSKTQATLAGQLAGPKSKRARRKTKTG
jgi:hypothetical protein